MNQTNQMLKDSNARMKKIMKGLESGQLRPDTELLNLARQEMEAQIKVGNMIGSFYAIASKNKRAMIIKGLERMNFIDQTTAVDLMLGDPEVDKVKCPLQDNLITRSECLDYSGKHSFDECRDCEIGIDTKRILLPEA